MSAESLLNKESPRFIIILLIIIGIPCIVQPTLTLYIIPFITCISFVFFVFYLYSKGQFVDIFYGIILGIIVTAIAAIIPIVGPIILIIWIIYNIAKCFRSIKGLLPDAIINVLLIASLITPLILDTNKSSYHYNDNSFERIGCIIVYIVVSLIYYSRIKKYQMTTKDYLFKFSLLWISSLLIILLIMMISMSIKAAFRTQINTVTKPTTVTQNVSAYMRGETLVDAYTREITRNITTTTIDIGPGTGGITASVLGKITHKEFSNEDVSPTTNIDHNFLTKDDYKTNLKNHFYRYDDFDNEKINNFIQSANVKFKNKHINKKNIFFYYDDTVFGCGDHGVILTDEYICCSFGKLCESFVINYDDIQQISMKGILNKKITIISKKNETHNIELTQSNKGAEKIYELIEYFSS